MSRNPGPGRTLLAIVLAVAGACTLFFGGIYAFSALREMGLGPGSPAELAVPILIISIVNVGLGGLMIRGGAKLMKPRNE